MPTLRTIARIVERMQITGVAKHYRAQTNCNARFVHHIEHRCQPIVQRADQITDSTGPASWVMFALTEIQQAIGGAAIAHFVIQAGQNDIISLAKSAIVFDQKLRHDKQRYAFHTRYQLAIRAGHFG